MTIPRAVVRDLHTGHEAARLMSLIIVGDMTSVYLAIAHGVDPTPVPVIERLKATLAGS